MPHPKSATIAILGADTLVEDILARVLEREGYTTRLLGAHLADRIDGLLDGVDTLLLAPGLDAESRRAFLEA